MPLTKTRPNAGRFSPSTPCVCDPLTLFDIKLPHLGTDGQLVTPATRLSSFFAASTKYARPRLASAPSPAPIFAARASAGLTSQQLSTAATLLSLHALRIAPRGRWIRYVEASVSGSRWAACCAATAEPAQLVRLHGYAPDIRPVPALSLSKGLGVSPFAYSHR